MIIMQEAEEETGIRLGIKQDGTITLIDKITGDCYDLNMICDRQEQTKKQVKKHQKYSSRKK